jgi:hypothetical protein
VAHIHAIALDARVLFQDVAQQDPGPASHVAHATRPRLHVRQGLQYKRLASRDVIAKGLAYVLEHWIRMVLIDDVQYLLECALADAFHAPSQVYEHFHAIAVHRKIAYLLEQLQASLCIVPSPGQETVNLGLGDYHERLYVSKAHVSWQAQKGAA